MRGYYIMQIQPVKQLRGEVSVPGDKSISHRSIMFGALAKGTTEITHFLHGADCLSTIGCFRAMGIDIEDTPECILVHGKGLHGLSEPSSVLDVGNSGTTTRLISGILSGQPFATTLSGDASLNSRPMKRIMEPLGMMGADILSQNGNGCAPLLINSHLLAGQNPSLHAIHYHSKVASAQVKSSVLLAGLYADGLTQITEPVLSRNHTELMLAGFGAHITSSGTTATIEPEPDLNGMKIEVPGDISSAAYFLAAGLMIPNSEIMIKNVGINPTRDGILRVAKEMGGDITILNEKTSGGEPTCDLLVRSSSLKSVTIGGEIIPTLIDEIPMIAVMACFAEGTTIIKDAQELKVKESNRIDTVVTNLKAMGAHIEATDDGMIIEGGYPLHGAVIDSQLDHRIAMSFAIGALGADGETTIEGADCVKISYPEFYETLEILIQ